MENRDILEPQELSTEEPPVSAQTGAAEAVEPADNEEPNEKRGPRFRGVNIAFTIVVALLMFLAGSLTGYFGRPFLQPTPTPTPDDRQQLLAMLISKTRHWKGSANAPVTMLEFSDYQ